MNTDINGSGGHWILGIVHVPACKIIIMDSSLVISKTYYQKYFFSLLHIVYLAHYQSMETNGLLKCNDYFKNWELIVSLDSIQQNNSTDCGPIVVANVFGLVHDKQVDHTPASKNLRKWIFQIVTVKDKEKDLSQRCSKDTINSNDFVVAEEVEKKDLVHNESTLNLAIPFNPKGLVIQFKETKVLFA